jgi:hypothetical protein
VQDFQIAMREAMPATKDTDTEEISSSIDEEGGAEDIPRELNALIKNLQDEKLTGTAADHRVASQASVQR